MSAVPAPVARSARPPLLLGGGALVLLLLVVLLTPSLRGGGWQDWVRHRPPAFSELSFPDAASLPTTFTPGTVLPLTAEVTNHRERATTLEWSVVVTDRAGGARRVDRTGRLDVGAGATRPLPVEVSLPESAPVRVSLELADGPAVAVLLEPAP